MQASNGNKRPRLASTETDEDHSSQVQSVPSSPMSSGSAQPSTQQADSPNVTVHSMQTILCAYYMVT